MTFIWRAGAGFAAHSRHTKSSEGPWVTDTGHTDPAKPRQPPGQRGFCSSQGQPASTSHLSSRAAADSLCLSSCDRGWGQLQARLGWPCTQSWASPPWPCPGCRLPTEEPSRGWHRPSLNTSPARHLVGTAGSSSTALIHCTCHKQFALPCAAFTAAVILYDAIYSAPSKPISVFTAKWSVKNG